MLHDENRYQFMYFVFSGVISGVIIYLSVVSIQETRNEKQIAELVRVQHQLTFLKPEREWEYNNTWQYIGDPYYRHQIYSAYFDPRIEVFSPGDYNDAHIFYGSVRIFAILPLVLQGRITCQIRYDSSFTDQVQPYEVLPLPEHFDMQFAAYAVTCPLQMHRGGAIVNLPEAVAISHSGDPLSEEVPTFIPISYPKGKVIDRPTKSLAVCIGPLQLRHNESLRIVEFIETYRLLGANKFYFYRLSLAPEVNSILEYYKTISLVQLNEWNFYSYEFDKEVRNGGIFAQYNECIFRATFVDGYRYVAIVDLDEILMPLKHNTLLDFLRGAEDSRTSAFVFKNVFFYKGGINDTSSRPRNVMNRLLYTQVKVQRTLLPLPSYRWAKCIVNARTIFVMGNHQVWHSTRGTSPTNVHIKEGLLFHYREKCQGCRADPLIVDFTARRFGSIIWGRVDEVCSKVFQDGICPTA